jgi:hypothetical protein
VISLNLGIMSGLQFALVSQKELKSRRAGNSSLEIGAPRNGVRAVKQKSLAGPRIHLAGTCPAPALAVVVTRHLVAGPAPADRISGILLLSAQK